MQDILQDNLQETLQDILQDNLQDTLQDILQETLHDILKYILQETLTVKSDDLTGRGNTLFERIIDDRSLNCELPDAFRVLSNDLKALCLEIILLSLSLDVSI